MYYEVLYISADHVNSTKLRSESVESSEYYPVEERSEKDAAHVVRTSISHFDPQAGTRGTYLLTCFTDVLNGYRSNM